MSATGGRVSPVGWGVAMLAVLAAIAVGLYSGADSGPELVHKTSAGQDTPEGLAKADKSQKSAPEEPTADAGSASTRRPGGPGSRPFQMTAPPGAIPPSTHPFESPEAAAAFVEDRVLDLFAAVTPELDPKAIHKSCEPDGRTCTFEGPWPGDDFLRDWLRAIADGRTGNDKMQGVKFSEFKPVDEGGQRRFVLIAHAP